MVLYYIITPESAMAAGADDFLAKPFEMNDLLAKIKKLTA